MTIKNVAADLISAAAELRKALAALLGVAAMLTEHGVLHGTAQQWATIGTAAGTVALTYLAPNGPILRGLDKLEDFDLGTGALDPEPEELAAPTSKPALDAAPHPSPTPRPPLVTGAAAPEQSPPIT